MCSETTGNRYYVAKYYVKCHITNINVHISEHKNVGLGLNVNVNKPELAKNFGQVRTKTINYKINTPSDNV